MLAFLKQPLWTAIPNPIPLANEGAIVPNEEVELLGVLDDGSGLHGGGVAGVRADGAAASCTRRRTDT
jgi:hypothetical protein